MEKHRQITVWRSDPWAANMQHRETGMALKAQLFRTLLETNTDVPLVQLGHQQTKKRQHRHPLNNQWSSGIHINKYPCIILI